jgi:hypothetical protein
LKDTGGRQLLDRAKMGGVEKNSPNKTTIVAEKYVKKIQINKK